MAGISIGGMASGLPPNIVEQLMQAERIPIQSLENKKQNHNTKLELVNDLETRLTKIRDSIGNLGTTKSFTDIQFKSSREDILTGTVEPDKSVLGSWNVEIKKTAEKSGVLTNGFPDKDQTSVGVGYLRFNHRGKTKDIYIDKDSATLEKIAQKINRSNMDIVASVIEDQSSGESQFKIMLSGVGVGKDSDVEFPTLYFLDGDHDFYFEKTKKAENALVSVDGFDFEIDDNTLKNIIPGVTLNLKQALPGQKIAVEVAEDYKVTGEKINDFITSVNSVLQFVQKQNAMDQNTDTRKTLGGDGIIRQVETRMQNLIQGFHGGTGSRFTKLNELGIAYNRNGLIEVNQEKFNNFLKSEPQEVRKFLVGDGVSTGFIPALKAEVKALLDGNFGPIGSRKRSIQNQITQLDNSISNKEKFLSRKEEMLKQKFARVEEMMSKIKAQGGSVGSIGN